MNLANEREFTNLHVREPNLIFGGLGERVVLLSVDVQDHFSEDKAAFTLLVSSSMVPVRAINTNC